MNRKMLYWTLRGTVAGLLCASTAVAATQMIALNKTNVLKPQSAKFSTQINYGNGQPVPDATIVTCHPNGVATQMRADVCKTLLDGYLNKMKALGRIDTNMRVVSILDTASISRARSAAATSVSNVTARRARFGTVNPHPSAFLVQKPPHSNTGRVPLRAVHTDGDTQSWSDSFGDPRYVQLTTSAMQTVVDGSVGSQVGSDLSASTTVFGSRVSLVDGNLMAMCDSTGGSARAYLDILGQTVWTQSQPQSTGNHVLNLSKQMTKSVKLFSGSYPVYFLTITLSVNATGVLGVEAQATFNSVESDPGARGPLRWATIQSVPRTYGSTTVEGVYAVLSASGNAAVSLTLRQVASDLGIDGVLSALAAIPGVSVPWNVDVAGGKISLNVNLCSFQLQFDAASEWTYNDAGPGAGTYAIVRANAADVVMNAIGDPSVTVSAFASYPDGFSIEVEWDWFVPVPHVTIDFNQISEGTQLWGYSGYIFSNTVPLANDFLVQQIPTGGNN